MGSKPSVHSLPAQSWGSAWPKRDREAEVAQMNKSDSPGFSQMMNFLMGKGQLPGIC